jgi:hypothetical protein
MSFRHNAAVCGGDPTTTTSLPPDCNGMATGSLAAVRCRLDALGGQIAADATLGSFRASLGRTLARATALARQGDEACAANDVSSAKRHVKRANRLLQNMAHRLSGLAARKRIDGSLRSSLLATIQGIRSEVAALRRSPCP